jgi:DnaJ homolog subfamily C member 28
MTDIEEHIRKAIEQGKFDDLPGKGQPAHLDDHPLADSDWRLAYHLLQGAGYSLPWIEQLKEIDAEIEAARISLRRAWEWRLAALSNADPPVAVEAEWQRAVQAFKDRAAQINQRIAAVNLQVPSIKFQRLKLNLVKEVEYVMRNENTSRP